MALLRTADARRARSIVSDLETIESGERCALAGLVPRLGEYLSADLSFSYGLLPRGDGVTVDFSTAGGFSGESYARDFRRVLKGQPVGWGAYNPLHPERRQRNAVRVVGAEIPWKLYDTNPDAAPLIENHRFLLESQQLRVLVCDGPVMLAWVGVFRRSPFGARERALLRRIVPALHKRLSLERAIDVASVMLPAFHAALENVAGAAFLVRAPDSVVHANTAGRALLARDVATTRCTIADAVRGAATRFAVTSVAGSAGAPRHWLVLDRPAPRDPAPRAAQLIREHSLTPRQGEVLAHLATGKANKTIAAILGCAEVTVELHVTAILAKLGCESRAAAVARFWMT